MTFLLISDEIHKPSAKDGTFPRRNRVNRKWTIDEKTPKYLPCKGPTKLYAVPAYQTDHG
jgi:hypothetical protein